MAPNGPPVGTASTGPPRTHGDAEPNPTHSVDADVTSPDASQSKVLVNRRRWTGVGLTLVGLVLAGISLGTPWWQIEGSFRSWYLLPGGTLCTGGSCFTSFAYELSDSMGLFYGGLEAIIVAATALAGLSLLLQCLAVLGKGFHRSQRNLGVGFAVVATLLLLFAPLFLVAAQPGVSPPEGAFAATSVGPNQRGCYPNSTFWGSCDNSSIANGAWTWGAGAGWFMAFAAAVFVLMGGLAFLSAQRSSFGKEGIAGASPLLGTDATAIAPTRSHPPFSTEGSRLNQGRLLGASITLIGLILVLVTLGAPWWQEGRTGSYGPNNTEFFFPGDVNCELGGGPCSTPSSVSNSLGLLYESIGIIVVVAAILAAAALFIMFSGAFGKRLSRFRVNLGFGFASIAMLLMIAAPVLLAGMQPLVWPTGPSCPGEGSSFWGSCTPTLYQSYTGPTPLTWSASVGWWIALPAGAFLLIGSLTFWKARKDPF
jgi:hypothetical protein